MDFKALLEKFKENKALLYGAIAAVVVVLALFVMVGVVNSSNANKTTGGEVKREEPLKEDVKLFTTDNIGTALEVQALLARQGIEAERELDGNKSVIVLRKKVNKMKDRDMALLAIVKSGLVDQHVGLEIFDKGDFTSTKEDKKIRLVRAINGELARLIRKIPPIENAQVFVSIPEQTFFKADKKPITATVQVTIPSGEKLDNMKVKAIKNLLLGAVQDLQAENISITDTNGNVYNSISDSHDDALARIEENDRYMQAKVAQQLDRLVGKGNYVVTVSTFLTQAPVEKTSIVYDPSSKTSVTEQGFTESLGDNSSDVNSATNAVSTYLPYGVGGGSSSASQDRKYSRSATETQYGVSKTQINEYMNKGVIEEISIAVSMEQSAVPITMSLQELKELIARSASPKVNPDNVSLAFIDSHDAILAPDKENELPKPEESGNPWWVVGGILFIGLIAGLKHITSKVKKESAKQVEELEFLRKLSQKQQQQLESVTNQASQLMQNQQDLAKTLLEQQNIQALQAQQLEQKRAVVMQDDINIKEVISELSADMNDINDSDIADNLKKWIDSN